MYSNEAIHQRKVLDDNCNTADDYFMVVANHPVLVLYVIIRTYQVTNQPRLLSCNEKILKVNICTSKSIKVLVLKMSVIK